MNTDQKTRVHTVDPEEYLVLDALDARQVADLAIRAGQKMLRNSEPQLILSWALNIFNELMEEAWLQIRLRENIDEKLGNQEVDVAVVKRAIEQNALVMRRTIWLIDLLTNKGE